MANSNKFVLITETENYLYYKNDYFDSDVQVIDKENNNMYELFSFGDDRMLIMNSGITYEQACNYEQYIEENDYPNETVVDWLRSDFDFCDKYELIGIESYIK